MPEIAPESRMVYETAQGHITICVGIETSTERILEDDKSETAAEYQAAPETIVD